MLISPRIVAAILAPYDSFEVLHVGAHAAEEVDLYTRWGASRVHWVEAQADLYRRLERELDPTRNAVYNGVAWSTSGEHMTFHVTNNSQSSSLFQLKEHLAWHPDVAEVDSYEVVTTRLDELVPDCNYLLVTLDIQGAELQALKGMGRLLDGCRVIYTEVNRAETYEGLDQVDSMDSWLAARGFQRFITVWSPGTGWGDAIYVRHLPVSAAYRARTLQAMTRSRHKLIDRSAALRRRLSQTANRGPLRD